MPDGVAVITGGGRGIGASIARSLAGDGWSVVVSARSRDQIDEIASETGGRAVPMDVASSDSVAKAFGEIGHVACSSRTPGSAARPTSGARSR